MVGEHIELVVPDDLDSVRADTVAWCSALRAAGSASDARGGGHRVGGGYRLLCAHRTAGMASAGGRAPSTTGATGGAAGSGRSVSRCW